MNKLVLLLLGIAAISLQGPACVAQDDPQRLAACTLSYRWHSAPMAPTFLLEYVVQIEPDRSGSLWYRFGPGSPEQGTTLKFRLTTQQDRRLISVLANAGVLRDEWKESRNIPTGASQESVTIEEPSGKTIGISSVLEEEPRRQFQVVTTAIRAAVPKAAWIAMDRDQRAYIASNR